MERSKYGISSEGCRVLELRVIGVCIVKDRLLISGSVKRICVKK